uniref:Uncharacterized protein n=1 Tax=Nelumbo nucifera TaxID=4432 RepID=A0A823A1J0_NELNU|nr:TPA_asm: hypothetical protein HUJ06_017965 [Nelumbo nucifera]
MKLLDYFFFLPSPIFTSCLGKVGIRYFYKLHNKFYCSIVNINKLWFMIPSLKMSRRRPPPIMFPSSMLPSSVTQPIVVKIKVVSKIAEKKIKEASGVVVPIV